MLLDTGADLTVIPKYAVENLDLEFPPNLKFRLESFDGKKSVNQGAELEINFANYKIRGKFPLIEQDYGIIGRNILNRFKIELDGQNLRWEILGFFRLPNPTRKIVSVSKALMIKSHRSLFYLEKLLMNKFLFSIFFALLFCSFTFAQESKPLNILEKPKPQLTEVQRNENINVQGMVNLRVEFLAIGKIGNISPVSTLPFGLTENAIEAAKKIKFEPEIKNGVAVTIFRVVQYSFSSNGGWSDSFQQRSQNTPKTDEKAEAVIKKAVEMLGGAKYLQVKSQIGRGKYYIIREGTLLSYQTFVDVIVFPDSERTEFKFGGVKTVQSNSGNGGWVFDGSAQTVNDQTEPQVENFKRGLRTSLDQLLRGYWRGKAELTYTGKREAGIGKRNEVIKLTFEDGFIVEFEFAATDGLPMKAIYKRLNADNEEVKEEDRYAQFIDVQGIKTPFIIDHFTGGAQTSRINYDLIEFNKTIPSSIFTKPTNAKDAKKDLKL